VRVLVKQTLQPCEHNRSKNTEEGYKKRFWANSASDLKEKRKSQVEVTFRDSKSLYKGEGPHLYGRV